uniref:Uncharacterized protein n=1 Tax=Physcomitrium patens TaxID=3218 RepID=A0A2K1IU25_PHYPA|nr:hypothetical protein PHYPA_024717 [Physcomitrium patens]
MFVRTLLLVDRLDKSKSSCTHHHTRLVLIATYRHYSIDLLCVFRAEHRASYQSVVHYVILPPIFRK